MDKQQAFWGGQPWSFSFMPPAILLHQWGSFIGVDAACATNVICSGYFTPGIWEWDPQLKTWATVQTCQHKPLTKKSRHQAPRFHFSEAIEKNPSEQKPTKVFESPITQNH